MKNFAKKIVALVLSCFMIFSLVGCIFSSPDSVSQSDSLQSEDDSSSQGEDDSSSAGGGEVDGMSKYIIDESDIPLKLQYDEQAPILDTENNPVGTSAGVIVADDSWEEWSLPVGNAYFGANVFGRTETERIQISEKTLTNPNQYINENSVGGLNSFSETYIDFGHRNNRVTDYSRYLDLRTAVSGVEYAYGQVKYSREYFTSYPDKALVIRLDADTAGALNFILRPTIPYEQEYMTTPGDGISKEGSVTSKVEDGVGHIELSGRMGYYGIDFLGIYKVYTNGGRISAGTAEHTYTDAAGVAHTDTDGTIVVEGADSAYIVVTLGTDYELSSELFTASDADKPTHLTTLYDTRLKVEAEMQAIEEKIAGLPFEDGYALLKSRHIEDYSSLFGRVTLDLDCDPSDFTRTTDELLSRYKDGDQSTYLETLLFQYGRYLLIASSREGALPAHLQGVWNTYNSPPWACNYTHNINVQMNYWPAFSTNLAETFDAYIAYNQAYMDAAKAHADNAILWNNVENPNKDGGNGWVIGHAATPYQVTYDASPGNLGFTTQIFWEYYQYTQDKEKLAEVIYPVLYSAAQFITKMVKEDENGKYLVANCDSPEQHVNGEWYHTSGTTYAQSFSYLNNYHLLLAAKELGIDVTDSTVLSKAENAVLKTVLEQIDKYDPIVVGLSGHVKEFREEEYYGDLGEWQHRHISQLVGLFPGNLINSTTPAWIDAAKVALNERGFDGVGWSAAHKICLWARTKDGNTAHQILANLINDCIAPNLWDYYFRSAKSTFQIEGNFGATAGMGEFLLQSDAGYIEPLAALPDAWDTGSYTGMVARGNFEVSASWEDGLAKAFNVVSKSGGKASVYYPSITSATVCTLDGEEVAYTVDGNNLISFETEVGETYIIYGFTAQNKPQAPQNFAYTRTGFDAFNFTWNAVANAEKYNLYVAVESQPDYTFIGSANSAQFSYLPEKENLNARMTFVVTAVNADSVESDRTLCYYNPVDVSAKINGASASVTEDGVLQVRVNANENSAKYRLYEKAEGESSYRLINESAFPLLYAEAYSQSSDYAVSVLSYLDAKESELFKIKDVVGAPYEYDMQNVLKGKEFVGAHGTEYDTSGGLDFSYAKLTDGDFAQDYGADNWKYGRYSSLVNGYADATVDLLGSYILSELRIYCFQGEVIRAGTNFTLQVLSNGTWVDIVTNLTNEQLSAYFVNNGSANDQKYLKFDMGCIEAQKIRVYAKAVTNNTVTWYEVECSGILTKEGGKNILEDKVFTGAEGTKTTSGYEYAKLTDGVIDPLDWANGRFSSDFGTHADATIDLNGVYALTEIRFYCYLGELKRIGKNFTLQVYHNGVWADIVKGLTNEQLGGYTLKNGNTAADTWISFALDGVYAEKIRFYSEPIAGNETVTLYEIECSGYKTVKAQGEGNAFAGATGSVSNGTVASGNPLSNAFDGNLDTYYEVNGDSSYCLEIDFGSVKALNTLEIHELIEDSYLVGGVKTTASNKTMVEVYIDGSWIKIAQGFSLDADSCTVIDMYGVKCSKIRITFENTNLFDGESSYRLAKIKEITCSTNVKVNDLVDMAKALNALSFNTAENLGYISNEDYITFKNYVLNADSLTQAQIDAYTQTIRNFNE